MDYFAHGFWSYAIYHNTEQPWWGVFWGVFPDTISWLPFMLYTVAHGRFGVWDQAAVAAIPKWVFFLYGLSHSIFTFAAVCLATYLILGHIPIYLWGWLIHILIDVPTHAHDFLPTPFLWPFSDWHFPGIGWGTPWFMVVNYAALALIYIYLFVMRKT